MPHIVLEDNDFTRGLKPLFPVYVQEVEDSLLLRAKSIIIDENQIAKDIITERMRQLEIKRDISSEKLEILEAKMLVDVLWQLRNANLCQINGVSREYKLQ